MFINTTWVLKAAIALSAVWSFPPPTSADPGDLDHDGDVDLSDYALFRQCLMGPQVPVLQLACREARFDNDLDVDLRDVAAFQSAFTGPCVGTGGNDCCAVPIAVTDGTRSYSNVGATTDGPDEPTMCDFFGPTNVYSDLWYCYTATCTGMAFVSLCGSDYDTKLAVYAGCACPTAPPLACSDDDCGRGVEQVQSRVEISVTQGAQYMIRVGGFLDEQGDGLLTIGCNTDSCAAGIGDCFTPSPTQTPGCDDPECCAETCELDQFCCDVTWDQTCAGEAQGICTGSFASCAAGSGTCGVPDTTPGCDDVDCCNTVCRDDPYCCLQEWDSTCVNEAEPACFLTCGGTAETCFAQHLSPGCNVDSCCQLVCTEDPFCCDTAWDQACADFAMLMCP